MGADANKERVHQPRTRYAIQQKKEGFLSVCEKHCENWVSSSSFDRQMTHPSWRIVESAFYCNITLPFLSCFNTLRDYIHEYIRLIQDYWDEDFSHISRTFTFLVTFRITCKIISYTRDDSACHYRYGGILATSKSREYSRDHPRTLPDLREIRLIRHYIRLSSLQKRTPRKEATRDGDVTHVYVRTYKTGKWTVPRRERVNDERARGRKERTRA